MVASDKNFYKTLKWYEVFMNQSNERLKVLEKIKEYERQQLWDQDVENDPPAKELFSKDIDYLNKKLSSKIATWFANMVATNFYEKLIKNNQLIIKRINGIENFLAVKGGAIITSNHFSPLENYAVWRTIKPYMGKRKLYRIIKEGNYTNPPKPFKFIMHHCNTLPLSRNRETMKYFLKSIDTLLSRGEKILIYPEQSMWWNYRKPRPLKNGAFKFAVSSNVPVIPFFITMSDGNNLDGDGFPVQEYTINIMPAIYPDQNLSKNENAEMMKTKNYEYWKQTYEHFYQTELTYEK